MSVQFVGDGRGDIADIAEIASRIGTTEEENRRLEKYRKLLLKDEINSQISRVSQNNIQLYKLIEK